MTDTEAALASARGVAYQLHATAFLPPDEKRRSLILSLGATLHRVIYPFSSYLKPLLEKLQSVSARELMSEYTRLFDAGLQMVPCPPFAAEHLADRGVVAQGEILAELDAFYRSLGIRVRSEVSSRPDHVTVEFETLSLLCASEQAALDEGKHLDVCSIRSDTRSFISDHVLFWFPGFQRRVHRHDRTGLYVAAVDSAYALLLLDRATLGALGAKAHAGAAS